MIYVLGGICVLLTVAAVFLWIQKTRLQDIIKFEKEKSARLEAEVSNSKETTLKLESVFKSLAGDVLMQSQESFLKLASERLDRKTTEASGAFSQKVLEIQKLMEPIRATMEKVEKDIRDVEKQRTDQFGRLSEQIIGITQTHELLRKETSNLSQALRKPGVKGSWGELQLRRVVEIAGMNSYCDFEEQVNNATEEGRQRPDLIVRLPNERVVVVDSKAVTEDYLKAIEASDDTIRKTHLDRHAKNLRLRVSDLSRKSYWQQFKKTPEFTVLFVPNEAILYAAVEVDPSLIEDALMEKIVIASPTNLVSLLKAVAYGWQQVELTESAEKVIENTKELYSRINTWMAHFGSVGKNLDQAVKSFNSAVGSLETRVLPSLKRVNELSPANEKLADSPKLIELSAREVAPPTPADEVQI
jgi:DNA recombination protein RmuC